MSSMAVVHHCTKNFRLKISASPEGIMEVHIASERQDGLATEGEVTSGDPEAVALVQEACEQLSQYLAGRRKQFTLPLAPAGTPFQQEVWRSLCCIPYGKVASYGMIAGQTGRPQAARAVGMANNRNPIAILIPCHRVVGANRHLTGYGAGLHVKKQLLQLEGVGLSSMKIQKSPGLWHTFSTL